MVHKHVFSVGTDHVLRIQLHEKIVNLGSAFYLKPKDNKFNVIGMCM
jgi:hypothetical protein